MRRVGTLDFHRSRLRCVPGASKSDEKERFVLVISDIMFVYDAII